MKYFLHDSNAFNDEKITLLFMEFGYEGLGLFYSILEKLAQQEKPVKTDVLKKQLFVGKKLEKCWKFMETIDIISSNNGETFNKQLLNFSEKFMIKKEKNRKRISEWRENQDNIKNVTCNESVRNTDKDNISKVKLSKVNNKESFDFSFVEVDYSETFYNWIDYKKERKQSYKTQKSLEACYQNLKLLSEFNPITAKQIVLNSISNNWLGLFKIKTDKQTKQDETRNYIASRIAQVTSGN
jgi:hypothetical protein